MIMFFVFVLFLCWGSFLNVVAYRSIAGVPFLKKRSFCTSCKQVIAWYHNIPVFSWLFLKGRCAYCHKKISWLYPFIEVLTAVLMTALFFHLFFASGIGVFTVQTFFTFLSYFVFFSALIVSIRTDMEALVIPQLFTIWLVPFGLIFAYYGSLRIHVLTAFLGALFGYGSLWFVAKVFKLVARKEGLGVGDMELLALIGAFLGPICVWTTIFIASISGLFFSAAYMIATKKKGDFKIPFGPFLALGAFLYFFFERWFILLLFG